MLSPEYPCLACGYPFGETRPLDVNSLHIQSALDTLIYGTSRLTKGMDIELDIEGYSKKAAFHMKRTLMLGRGEGADIDLSLYVDAHSLGVSRKHASLHRILDRVTIRDLGSANGTWLGLPEDGGMQLKPEAMYTVRDGIDLLLGELRITIYFIGGSS